MVDLLRAPVDERTARVMLACASEPGDPVTGRLVQTFGAAETVRLGHIPPSGDPTAWTEADHWRARVGPRLSPEHAQSAMLAAGQIGAHLLTPVDDAWPADLQRLGVEEPVALWVAGDPAHLNGTSISVLGARAATAYGSFVATELASDAASQGVTVVSTGSYGIAGAAHRAAIMNGGATVAVLAGGIDRPYPAGHTQLFEQVARSGALVSEVAPGAAPTKHRFQQRGRLIAALSDAVVVAEAGYRSGALQHAIRAAEFGRPVGAIPGPVTTASSAGCHRLLGDGTASVITNFHDVTEMLKRSSVILSRSFGEDLLEAARLSAPATLQPAARDM